MKRNKNSDDKRLNDGARVGEWTVREMLGSGGQAEVYTVGKPGISHTPRRAMKLAKDTTANARFEREVELLKDLSHPHLVKIVDSDEFQSRRFYVMERANSDFGKVIQAERAGSRLISLSGELTLGFLRQSLEALAYLHSKDIVHRDVKPSNILLFLDPPDVNRAALSDLGIAARLAEVGTLTASHEVVGTPVFRAPETERGEHSLAGDVYSFGRTLESILNGVLSPAEPNPRLIRDGARQLSARLWDELDALVEACCRHNVKDRPKSAADVLALFPRIHVDVAGAAMRSNPMLDLSENERQLLAHVVGACLLPGDRAFWRHVRSRSRASDVDFRLGMQGLIERNMVAMVTEEDGFGKDQFLFPTPLGIQFARQANLKEPITVSVPDSDIPF